MDLTTPVAEISGVGPQYQKRLKHLGIKTLGDLIFHFPHRYEDFSNLIKVADIKEGGPAFAEASAGKPFSFQGEILEMKNIRTPKKRMVLTQAEIYDGTGKLKVIWFNQPYLINTFNKGDYVCLAGKISKKGSAQYLSSPAYEKIPNSKFQIPNSNLTHTGRLIPVYPETDGLSSRWLRFIVKPVLLNLKGEIQDPLPEIIKQKFAFPPLKEAVWQIHFPDNLERAQRAKKRFAFEELFNLSIFVLREKMKLTKEKARAIAINLELIKEFTQKLPFTLTNAQKKSAWQILQDLEKPQPMNRLLEGDVGSGKTVVAALAALNVAKEGFQVAFMSPTEILAKQHYDTFCKLLSDFNLKIGLLTGKEKTKGVFHILVGTHALIQEKVKFKNLALVIVDEQHRFGVEQRAKLCQQKEFIPHLLSMTATPIPRTLSLTLYGDLDLSILDELPKGRKKVITEIIGQLNKKETYNFIRKKVKEGRQAFVICPRIEPRPRAELGTEQARQQELSWLDVKAVKEEYEKLSKIVFPDLKVGMLHGKMKTKEKQEIMQNFKDGKIDILVSTSVVEVGVDVPNATIMMIEGAEKFGLAQLHQFRGRVGRSEHQSYCFLFTESSGKINNRRLKALISSESGFELAEKDLQIRGPGDFSGQRQWGLPDLAMASLADVSLVEKATKEAREILAEDPELMKYPLLGEKLKEFRQRIHLE